jgi:hypothetical protein
MRRQPILRKIGAQLVRRIAAGLEIVVDGLLNAGDRPAKIDGAGHVMQVVHRRMRQIIGTEHLCRLVRLVGVPLVGNGKDRKDHALRLIAQGDVLTRFDRGRRRPRLTSSVIGMGKSVHAGHAHAGHDAFVIRLRHEPLQRKEPAVHQKFQIADLTRRQVPRPQHPGFVPSASARRIGRDIKLGNRHVDRARTYTAFRAKLAPPAGVSPPVIRAGALARADRWPFQGRAWAGPQAKAELRILRAGKRRCDSGPSLSGGMEHGSALVRFGRHSSRISPKKPWFFSARPETFPHPARPCSPCRRWSRPDDRHGRSGRPPRRRRGSTCGWCRVHLHIAAVCVSSCPFTSSDAGACPMATKNPAQGTSVFCPVLHVARARR